MPSVITWSSIELLHNVIRTLNYLAVLSPSEGGRPLPKVTYRAKVKLHGTNCGVQVYGDEIVTQSRETILTPEADLKGFSKWAHARGLGNSAGDHWAYFSSLTPGITVFGEWCGPGVEPGMAVSSLPEKLFAVFGIQVGMGEQARVVSDPAEIENYLHGSAGYMPRAMHILPWLEGVEFTIDFADASSLQAAADYLNKVVEAVEKEDPWIKSTFGVSGMGEGVVLYPVRVEGGTVPTHPETLAQLMFKAKGEKHRTTRQKEAVQVAPEIASGITGFIDLVVTEARLEQGLSITCGGQRDPKMTGKFLQWVVSDVQKETKAEMEAAGLTWAQVQGAVQTRAREWFLRR